MAMTDVTWLTQQAHDRLVEELAEREGPTRVEITKRIEAAREEGDLKENGGYHAAKEEPAHASIEVYSPTSPLGSAVDGKKVGEVATYELANGKQMSVEIMKVEAYTN